VYASQGLKLIVDTNFEHRLKPLKPKSIPKLKTKSKKINTDNQIRNRNREIQNQKRNQKNKYRYPKLKSKSGNIYFRFQALVIIIYNNIIIMQDMKMIMDTNFEYRFKPLKTENKTEKN